MKKILVIRFSSIGDIVLTSPVVRCIKKKYPEAEIHFLTKSQFQEIPSNNPHISKVFSIEKSPLEVMDELKSENYDYIVDLHKNIRSMITRSMLMKPGASFNKLNFRKWLLVKTKINQMPSVHVVDRYFEAVKEIGVENDKDGLDFFIPKKDEVLLSSLPPEFHDGYICLVIGANHFTKKIPTEKIIDLVAKLNKPIVLIGGKGEFQEGEIIKSKAGTAVFNACGIFNICESASLLRQSEKVITPDTGMMHIASAFRKEIVSIWGNTIPAFGMYPYMPGNEALSRIVEVKGLSCRPCSKIGFSKCPEKHFRCMNDIDLREVVGC